MVIPIIIFYQTHKQIEQNKYLTMQFLYRICVINRLEIELNISKIPLLVHRLDNLHHF